MVCFEGRGARRRLESGGGREECALGATAARQVGVPKPLLQAGRETSQTLPEEVLVAKPSRSTPPRIERARRIVNSGTTKERTTSSGCLGEE